MMRIVDCGSLLLMCPGGSLQNERRIDGVLPGVNRWEEKRWVLEEEECRG